MNRVASAASSRYRAWFAPRTRYGGRQGVKRRPQMLFWSCLGSASPHACDSVLRLLPASALDDHDVPRQRNSFLTLTSWSPFLSVFITSSHSIQPWLLWQGLFVPSFAPRLFSLRCVTECSRDHGMCCSRQGPVLPETNINKVGEVSHPRHLGTKPPPANPTT